jgi:hypothetical protein
MTGRLFKINEIRAVTDRAYNVTYHLKLTFLPP